GLLQPSGEVVHVLHMSGNLLLAPLVHRRVIYRLGCSAIVLQEQVLSHLVLLRLSTSTAAVLILETKPALVFRHLDQTLFAKRLSISVPPQGRHLVCLNGEMARILILGGTAWVGNRLAEKFLA